MSSFKTSLRNTGWVTQYLSHLWLSTNGVIHCESYNLQAGAKSPLTGAKRPQSGAKRQMGRNVHKPFAHVRDFLCNKQYKHTQSRVYTHWMRPWVRYARWQKWIHVCTKKTRNPNEWRVFSYQLRWRSSAAALIADWQCSHVNQLHLRTHYRPNWQQ